MLEEQRQEARAQTQRRILDAAEARYRFYGFRKTTMTDIADDLDMSPANLYRFFENKQALAVEVVARFFEQRRATAEAAAMQAGMDSRSRVRAFVQALLSETWNTSINQPRINELIEIITLKHRGVVHRQIAAEVEVLTRIFRQDPEISVQTKAGELAKTVHAAIALFRVPLFMPYYDIDDLRTRADLLVDCLFDGLLASGGSAST